MPNQPFEYQWKWEPMLLYPMVILLLVGLFYAYNLWKSRQKGVSPPSFDLRFSVPLALVMGLALGALANSNNEFDEAQAHRQGNWEALAGKGYMYKETLDGFPVNEEVMAGSCTDMQVVDWDFSPVTGDGAVQYHVFCHEGELKMEIANYR